MVAVTVVVAQYRHSIKQMTNELLLDYFIGLFSLEIEPYADLIRQYLEIKMLNWKFNL